MKKFLFTTTALISMSAATAALAGGSHAPEAAAPANTGGLTVMVGGDLNFQTAFIDQDENNTTNGLGNNGSADYEFRNDTTINVTAAGSSDDFDYGAVVELEADTSEDKDQSSVNNADKTYIYLENDSFGRFEAGATASASQTMEVDASNIARGTGGIDGDWRFNVDRPVSGGSQISYILQPNLPLAELDDTNPDSNKITYYTSRFSGLQLGVSFTPDSADSGTAAVTGSDVGTGYESVISGGLSFESDLEGVGITAAAVGEWGDAKSPSFGTAATAEDLAAYSLGLALEVDGFSVAGNWADQGETGTAITSTSEDESDYWTLGAAYENGPYGVSVTYLQSETGTGTTAGATVPTGTHEVSNVVVGADYQMAPGLTPYVEAAFFDLENGGTTAAADNSGSVVLLGADVAF